MATNSPLYQMMQRLITFDVDCIVKAMLKSKDIQVTGEVLMNLLKTGYGAPSAGLNNTSYQHVENVLS